MKNIMSINSVIFDLDNTLYDESIYFKYVIECFCSKIKKIDKIGVMHRAYFKYRNSSKDIFNDLLVPANLPYDNINKDLLFEIYCTINAPISLYDDALMILEYLKLRKMNVFILTNGLINAQKNKAKLLCLHSYCNEIIYARIYGKKYEKPHSRSFVNLLKDKKILACNLLAVGDNLSTDFRAPKKLGIKTVRLLRGLNKDKMSNKYVDFEINNLLEIKKNL